MNNLLIEIWSKYWGENTRIENSPTQKLLSNYLGNLSGEEQKKILNKVIPVFRSLSVIFRWIYFELFKEEDLEPEIVAVIDPIDLENLNIKEDSLFQYQSTTSENPSDEMFELGKSKCPNCGSINDLKDNRAKKANAPENSKIKTIPDFTCARNNPKWSPDSNGCGWGGYINTNNSSNKVPKGWVSNDNFISVYDDISRDIFQNWNIDQINKIDKKLLKKETLYDSQNSKVIKNYWTNDADKEKVNNYRIRVNKDYLVKDIIKLNSESVISEIKKHFNK